VGNRNQGSVPRGKSLVKEALWRQAREIACKEAFFTKIGGKEAFCAVNRWQARVLRGKWLVGKHSAQEIQVAGEEASWAGNCK